MKDNLTDAIELAICTFMAICTFVGGVVIFGLLLKGTGVI